MSEQNLVQAIHDLTRVVVAFSRIASKSDAARRLHLVAMPPSRIASLLAMPPKDVTSQISKMRKANGGGKEKRRG